MKIKINSTIIFARKMLNNLFEDILEKTINYQIVKYIIGYNNIFLGLEEIIENSEREFDINEVELQIISEKLQQISYFCGKLKVGSINMISEPDSRFSNIFSLEEELEELPEENFQLLNNIKPNDLPQITNSSNLKI